MASVRLDPEFAAVLAALPKDGPLPMSTEVTVEGIRTAFANQLKQVWGGLEWPEGMRETTHTTPSADGSTLRITQFVPRELTSPDAEPRQRAVIYIFGGGTVAGSVELCRPDIALKAAATQTQYFGVHYRLAPENPYPAALHDVYAAVRWLQENAAGFNIDPARIVLSGPSAGGLLAAATALYARDQKLSPPIAGMLLMYPMLDDQTTLAAEDPMRPLLTVTPEANALFWESYLGRPAAERNSDNVPIYASPSRAADVCGLPRAYIDIGGLDLFRDETLAFGGKLAAASVDLELHLYPGLLHGFDFAPGLTASKISAQQQKRFIESF
ncbi:Alpha/Beta hydrolase protein [Microdochium bolleyi]|uniref:Alpha/Beta hydrolase protein n=1 Tax=Microdochium bolleyi TaxID=196109 RepID=A0A136JFJ4_9PEZI|nr:Alpha/Beta hydrolase protein [Microdochium bolleyi]